MSLHVTLHIKCILVYYNLLQYIRRILKIWFIKIGTHGFLETDNSAVVIKIGTHGFLETDNSAVVTRTLITNVPPGLVMSVGLTVEWAVLAPFTYQPVLWNIIMVLLWCYYGVTVVLLWCYHGVTMVLLWCYYSDINMLPNQYTLFIPPVFTWGLSPYQHVSTESPLCVSSLLSIRSRLTLKR